MHSIIKNRKIFALEGKDRCKFFQGLITNDINKVQEPNRMIYALMLTPQGKYFCDFFITNYKDVILFDIPLARSEEILKKLNIYKLRSIISFSENPDLSVIFSSEAIEEESLCFRDPRSFDLGWRIYSKNLNNYHTDRDYYNEQRIELLIPEGDQDLIEQQSFPLEFGLENFNAFDFNKGCYVGQEVIARTYYKGVIRKTIVKIISDEEIFSPLGAPIFLNDIQVGITCSIINKKGLALIRNEFIDLVNDDNIFKLYDKPARLKLKGE